MVVLPAGLFFTKTGSGTGPLMHGIGDVRKSRWDVCIFFFYF
jgi:hypothetical protein